MTFASRLAQKGATPTSLEAVGRTVDRLPDRSSSFYFNSHDRPGTGPGDLGLPLSRPLNKA